MFLGSSLLTDITVQGSSLGDSAKEWNRRPDSREEVSWLWVMAGQG